MSIRFRLLLSLLLIALFGYLGISWWVQKEFRDSYAQIVEEILSDYAHLISAEIENGNMSKESLIAVQQTFQRAKNLEFKSKILDYVKTKSALEFYVTDKKGMVISSSREGEIGADYSNWNDVYKTLRGEYGARSTPQIKGDSRSSSYFVAAPIRIDSEIVGVASVYKTEGSILSFLDRALAKIFIGGLFFVVAVGLFSSLIMLWIISPLNRLKTYARIALEISEGKRAKLPITHIREIKQLGMAFETMRISLEGKKTVEKYTQTLTHELKSPLTAIKGAAELCLEDMPMTQRQLFLSSIIDEADRSNGLLEQLLHIAELEAQGTLEKKSRFELVDLLNEVKHALIGGWHSRKIDIEINAEFEFFVTGERILLFQAIRNIIQNAIDFSDPHSKIEINVESSGIFVDIVVRDEGSGIPEYAKDRVFEKFYSLKRPNSMKKSSGLGLSLVKEILDLHDGSISINSPLKNGRGTRVSLRLPFHSSSNERDEIGKSGS